MLPSFVVLRKLVLIGKMIFFFSPVHVEKNHEDMDCTGRCAKVVIDNVIIIHRYFHLYHYLNQNCCVGHTYLLILFEINCAYIRCSC